MLVKLQNIGVVNNNRHRSSVPQTFALSDTATVIDTRVAYPQARDVFFLLLDTLKYT